MQSFVPNSTNIRSFSTKSLLEIAADPVSMDTTIPESCFQSDRLYIVGICAMEKKAHSLPMQAILSRFPSNIFKVVIFGDHVILNQTVDQWPVCDIFISFYSTGFPLHKAQDYVNLHHPIVLNDVTKQELLLDRRKVYQVLQQNNIPLPNHVFVNRDNPSNNIENDQVLEYEDYIQVRDVRIAKPFVEKPVDGENHNIYIYYPMNAGGGCKKLFRKIGSRSSVFDPHLNTIRRTGSFIYEEFQATQGTDVKVYTVGPNYAHAEARKSPVLDGRVLRDADGKEIRYPVILEPHEKEMARKVCLAFGQTVCGFDILRVHNESLVCDVNGWSFVKNSEQYYDDCAMLLVKYLERALLLRKLAKTEILGNQLEWRTLSAIAMNAMNLKFSVDEKQETANDSEEWTEISSTGEEEELRCVLAIIRHGDRTPKQKMKMFVCHPLFIQYFQRKSNSESKKLDLKIKAVADLEELLQVSRELIAKYEQRDPAFMAFLKERKVQHGEDANDRVQGYRTLCDVLQRWRINGINRKVQFKPKEYVYMNENANNEVSFVQADDMAVRRGSTGGLRKCVSKLLLILKWGGDLTHSGAEQAEALGHKFRQTMYPGGGHGLIRLHSTYRHDLKIYTSDEGRVQKTAAMFAKGFLSLEGDIIPILVGLVLKAKAEENMLDQSGSSVQETIMRVKQRLHRIIHLGDNCTELLEHSSSRLIRSVAQALVVVDQPVKKMELMHKFLSNFREQLTKMIQEKSMDKTSVKLNNGEKVSNSDGRRMSLERARSLSANVSRRDQHPHVSGESKKKDEKESRFPEPCGRETLEMMRERWAKLRRDFYSRKRNTFDLSKIPDIHDCVRYDALHNAHLCLKDVRECLDIAASLAHALVPQEYGIDIDEKIQIGSAMCRTLLMKIVDDLDLARGVHANPTHRLNPNYAKDKHAIRSKNRSVRTRLYFTSESHLHSLLNVLRYAREDCDIPSPISDEAKKAIEEIPELCYMTHFVVRVFERFHLEKNDPKRFRLEISLSCGAANDPLEQDVEKQLEIAPLRVISREGITCQELVDYFEDVIAFAEEGEAAFNATSSLISPEEEESGKSDKKESESELDASDSDRVETFER